MMERTLFPWDVTHMIPWSMDFLGGGGCTCRIEIERDYIFLLGMIDLFGHETCIVEIEQYIDLINLQLHFYRADERAYLQGGYT